MLKNDRFSAKMSVIDRSSHYVCDSCAAAFFFDHLYYDSMTNGEMQGLEGCGATRPFPCRSTLAGQAAPLSVGPAAPRPQHACVPQPPHARSMFARSAAARLQHACALGRRPAHALGRSPIRSLYSMTMRFTSTFAKVERHRSQPRPKGWPSRLSVTVPRSTEYGGSVTSTGK